MAVLVAGIQVEGRPPEPVVHPVGHRHRHHRHLGLYHAQETMKRRPGELSRHSKKRQTRGSSK